MHWLIDYIARILHWLLDLVAWVLLEVLKLLLEGLLAVFNAIPLCPCFSTAADFLSAMPSGVAYFAQGFHLSAGIGAILCGLLLRFLIRRIPFIG